MSSAARRLLVAIFLSSLAVAPVAQAQSTRSWTGLAAPDKNWTTLGNWNTGVPISGDTALFNGTGNANTSVSLSAATQPIKNILFDTASAAPYTLGVLASGDKFNFDSGGAITVNSTVISAQTINAAVQANGALTVTNSGSATLSLAGNMNFASTGTLTVNNAVANTTTTLGGNITDVAGQPGSLSLQAANTGASNNNNFIINGTNTYTGPTTIQVNTGSSGSIQLGSDTPFGTGAVTVNLVTGSSAPQFSALGGARTIGNTFNLSSGMTFVGSNSLNFTGPIAMSASGRTINNNLASGTLTFGSANSPSTITLPTSGGQTFTITGAGATVVNDVIQNASPAPTPAASILLSGTGPITLNGLNTYTGDTSITGSNIIRIGASSNALPGPSFTAGPFGTGTLNANSATTPSFQPIGADRTVANAVTIGFGFITSNATLAQDPTGSHNLTFTGPITLGATSRIITNNMVSGVALTLGSAATPSTISLGSTLTFQTQAVGSGLTIINDAVTGVGGLTVQNGGVVQLNGSNDYAGATAVTGTGSPKLFVNGSKTGTGAVTIDAVGTLGGTGSIAGTITNSGTIAPGNSVGTLTATGNVTMNTNSHLAIELGGATADKLVVGGNLNLSNVDFLDITGAGSGLSWVIATYGTLTGTFNNITSGYTVNYGTGTNSQITLIAPPSGVKGDFNNDGKVDAGDYITWRKNNGTNNALVNDNGLGTPVGPSHYTLWRNNFGKPPGSGSGDLVGGAVPEPASLLLVLLGIAGFSATRARRR